VFLLDLAASKSIYANTDEVVIIRVDGAMLRVLFVKESELASRFYLFLGIKSFNFIPLST